MSWLDPLHRVSFSEAKSSTAAVPRFPFSKPTSKIIWPSRSVSIFILRELKPNAELRHDHLVKGTRGMSSVKLAGGAFPSPASLAQFTRRKVKLVLVLRLCLCLKVDEEGFDGRFELKDLMQSLER
jgi:hypothetical protein